MGAELSHTDGWTDRYNEANSSFRNFAKAPKCIFYKTKKRIHCVLRDVVKDIISTPLTYNFKQFSFVHISTLMIGLRINIT